MPKATVRANARPMPKSRPSPRPKTTRTRAPAKRREPDDPVGRLSFVASRDGKTLPLATKGQDGRCFWHVKPTGDYSEDCITGEHLALEYLNHENKHWLGGLLQRIVMDMPRGPDLKGVEVGFLAMVAYAAATNILVARDCVAKNDRWRAQMAAEAEAKALRRNARLLKLERRKRA